MEHYGSILQCAGRTEIRPFLDAAGHFETSSRVAMLLHNKSQVTGITCRTAEVRDDLISKQRAIYSCFGKTKMMAQTEIGTTSLELTQTAVRLLKASARGVGINDHDLQILRAAADAEDRELSSDELACHIVLREIRKRRLAAMDAAAEVKKASSQEQTPARK